MKIESNLSIISTDSNKEIVNALSISLDHVIISLISITVYMFTIFLIACTCTYMHT